MNKRWKRAEDWWWKQTGWNREGHIKRGVPCADLTCELFSLDVTTRKKLPALIVKEMADAKSHSKDNQIPLVAIHAEGEDMKDGVVIMTVKDFLELHG